MVTQQKCDNYIKMVTRTIDNKVTHKWIVTWTIENKVTHKYIVMVNPKKVTATKQVMGNNKR